MNRIGILNLLVMLGLTSPLWGLTVSPARTEIRIPAGKSLAGELRIHNETAALINVTVSTKDWFVLEQNKNIGVDSWLKVKGRKQFSLKPGEERQVHYQAKPPREAQGELVGMVSFLYEKEEASMVTPMISVSVYVAIDGTDLRTGEIRDVAVNQQAGITTVVCTVKSTGNAHIRPRGQVQVVDGAGKIVADWPIRSGDPIYPASERQFSTENQKMVLSAGRYKVRTVLEDKTWNAEVTRGFVVSKKGDIRMDDSL